MDVDEGRHILQEVQSDFMRYVDARAIAQKARMQKIIPEAVEIKINESKSLDAAKQVLFEHLHDQVTLEGLRRFCSIMIESEGYQLMQEFGKGLQAKLEEVMPRPGSSQVSIASASDVEIEGSIEQQHMLSRARRKRPPEDHADHEWKRQKDSDTADLKAVVPFVHPAYDVEEADRCYLKKAIMTVAKNKKLDTLKLKKDLYRHTYYSVERILDANPQYFRHMVRAAELATEDEEDAMALTTTRTVAELLDKLCMKTKWEDTELLVDIVLCLPKEPRTLARKLLKRYEGYLEVYDNLVPAQDSLQMQLAVPEGTKPQVPVQVTVKKCLDEFMNQDCKDIVNLLLHNSYKIPRINIMVADIQPGCTTVIFLIDKAFTENIIYSSRKVSPLWAFQELRVTRVHFGDFELNVVQLLTQHFKEALRSGLTGSMDFVGATKALPYQVYALVDPDISEKLVIRTVYGKIAQPYSEQEGLADSEGVETTPEMGGADKDSALTAPSGVCSKRIPHRWWLKVSAGSYDTSLLPSSPMKQAEGGREMEGEVVFRRDTKSNLLKAVSGTEWMYRRRTLERSRRHQFTRYHQSWLADNVQKEEEESCKQWLLQLSPDVGSVREGEEQGLMSKVYKQALRDYQEKIAGVLIVKNIISDLKPYLTTVEYLQVKNKLGNMAQVDELFRILLTKGNGHFKGFCHVLEDNGYQYWAQQLRSSTDGAETEGPMSDYTSKALIALRPGLKITVMMQPLLMDMLQLTADGFMNPAEEQSVRNAENPMEELIAILLGKGDKEFNTFCDILERSNHHAWANRLRQKEEWYRVHHKWQLAYEDSIRKHGSVSVEVAQSIFVGPSAAGKSTVKHLLVHNEPKPVKTSTAALETPEVVTKRSAMDFSSEQYAVQEGTSAWQPVSSDIMKNSLHDCIASEAYEEKNQFPIEVESKEAEDAQRGALIMKQAQSDPFALDQYPIEKGQLEAEERDDCFLPKQAQSDPIALLSQYPITERQHEAEERDGCPLPKRSRADSAMLDQQYFQVLEEMRGEGGRIKLQNASFIHLLDTGGQPSFQDVLPLLLDVPCTYIQVFNASRSLSERIPVTYRPNDHTVVSLGDAECGRDMMLRSFSSMHTVSQKYSKELATFQQKDSPPPQLRIFVVGTHKDELIAQGRLDEATREIKTFLETLKGKPYYNSIQCDSRGQKFFLINALSVNERAYINNLREHISSEGFLKLDVPLLWFICQEVTRCTPKKFFRLQDLEAFCRKHHFVDGENAASQFRALLQLLTLLGFYAFFDLEDVQDEANFVCTDRDVFLREVSTLLAVQFSDSKGPEMESFKETGILVFTQKCFKQLGICQEMDAQWFLKALQHLGIAAHLPSKDGLERYFIPAALPQRSRDQKPTASVAPLCLTYTTEEDAGSSQYSYMPRGVFCRLAVELIHQGWKIIAKESTRTLLLFRWREFQIFLKENSGYISLIPQVVEEISTIPELHTQCECLLDTVRDGLSLSAKAVLGSNFRDVAELAVGFECPCKEVGMDHLAVPSETGKSLDCLGTCKSHPFSNEQRIWFSSLAGVHGVELVKDTKLRIWVIGERPPEPQPKPQPPQPSPSPPVPREGDGALCQEVTDCPDHLILLRRYVSRNAAGKASAVLEGVGLETSTIDACFSAHLLNDEEVVQAGLVKWRDGQGNKQPPTWEVLISAMEYAGVALEHVKGLKEKLALYVKEPTET